MLSSLPVSLAILAVITQNSSWCKASVLEIVATC